MYDRLFRHTVAFIITGMCLLSTTITDAAKPDKFSICHVPPDNPINVQPIEVGFAAIEDHMAHGDWFITEEKCDAIADNNCDGVADPIADDADCESQLYIGATCVAGLCEQPMQNEPIGTITADIVRGGIPSGTDRGVEAPAVNLVADAQLWATSWNGAEIAFMNPGGVRSDLLYAESEDEGDGVVTYMELFTFQPFGNDLLTFPMTGSQIIDVLTEQCQPLGLSRPFLHLGVSDGFTYDLATTIVGDICTSISVSNVKLNGVSLNPVETYFVTANNFLADGGDHFSTFATIDPASRIYGGTDYQAITSYFATFSPVAPPSTDRVNELP